MPSATGPGEPGSGGQLSDASAALTGRSSFWVPQAPSPHPLSNRYSVGDGSRTGRFMIQLTFYLQAKETYF